MIIIGKKKKRSTLILVYEFGCMIYSSLKHIPTTPDEHVVKPWMFLWGQNVPCTGCTLLEPLFGRQLCVLWAYLGHEWVDWQLNVTALAKYVWSSVCLAAHVQHGNQQRPEWTVLFRFQILYNSVISSCQLGILIVTAKPINHLQLM